MFAVVVVALASRSVAYPVALAALPTVAIALIGSNPFPHRSVTLGVAAWVVLGVVLDRASDRELPLRATVVAPVLLTVALAVWMVVRLGGAPVDAQEYGGQKLQLFLISNVPLLVAGLLIARRRRHFDLYVVLTLVMAALSAFAIARGIAGGAAPTAVGGRFSVDAKGNPIGLGRDAARGLLLAVFVLLVGRALPVRVFALAAIPLLTVPFLASGSRGPTLGLVVGAVVLFALVSRDRRSRRRVALVAAGAVAAVFLAAPLVPGANVQRTLSVLTGASQAGADSGLSSNGRFELWSDAWNGFVDHPLDGLGTGGFASLRPIQLYAHNIVLEVASELGIVGLVLMTGTLACGVYGIARVWRSSDGEDRAHAALAGGLLAAAFTNASLSADIANNDVLWLAVGLAAGLTLRLPRAATAPSVLAIRPRLGERRLPRPAVRRPPQVVPELLPPGVIRSPGAITAPSDGSTVAGHTLVQARPADTGWGVATLTIELRAPDGAWTQLAVVRDEGYDILADEDGRPLHVAIVRSRTVAELMRDALRPLLGPLEIEPSRRRPWRGGASRTATWDAGAFVPGTYALRAVTIDAAGARVVSPEVTVEVAAAGAEEALHPRAAAEGEISVVGAAQDLASLDRALGERERSLDERAVRLAGREASIGAGEAELRTREERIHALARELGARERAVAEREQRAQAEAAELDRREELVERRTAAVSGRKRALVERADRLGARERLVQEPPPAAVPAVERPVAPAPPVPSPPPPAPAVEPRPEPLPAPVPTGRELSLWTLERLVAEHPDPDPYVQEEREATVYSLRAFATAGGTLPETFRGLVEEMFGPQLARS